MRWTRRDCGPFRATAADEVRTVVIRVTSAVEGGRPKDPANAEDRVLVKAHYAVGLLGVASR